MTMDGMTDLAPSSISRMSLKTVAILAITTGAAVAAVVWTHSADADPQAVPHSVEARADQSGPSELAPADLFDVSSQTMGDRIAVAGELHPANKAPVKAKVGGRIRDVLVKSGQPVSAGDVILRLETDDLASEVRRATATLRGAEAQHELAAKSLQKQRTLQVAKATALNDLEKAEAEAQATAANVAALQAQLDTARDALANAEVRTPIDGVVWTRSVEPGETVAAGADLLTVVDTSSFEAEVLVSTRDVAKLTVGQQATLSVDGVKNRDLSAAITRISPSSDTGTRFVRVYLQFQNMSDVRLWGGMFASGFISVSPNANVIAIPEVALRGVKPDTHVYVIVDGKLAFRRVTVGRTWSDSRLVEITSGLKAGDKVVRTQLPGLSDGMSVKVTGNS